MDQTPKSGTGTEDLGGVQVSGVVESPGDKNISVCQEGGFGAPGGIFCHFSVMKFCGP